MYHRHLCRTCNPPTRWSCGPYYNRGSPCPGVVAGKAVDAPHRWHKVLDVEEKP